MKKDVFSMNPWAVVLRGAVALIFGTILMAWPGVTLELIILLFAAFAVVDGIFVIIMAFVTGRKENWLVMIPLGVVGIVIGLLVLFYPGISFLILVYLVAAWAFIIGVSHIISVFAMKEHSAGVKWLYAISGLLTIFLGALLVLYPIDATFVFVWVLGLYAMVFGIFMILTGLWLRSMNAKIEAE